jgi:hypothetical protein
MSAGSNVKTLEVTNFVASIQFTGAMTIDCQYSSDEETVEAVNFISETGNLRLIAYLFVSLNNIHKKNN